MDEGAIVICNLAKGRLGESVAHLLGALLTSSIAQGALSRADVPAAERRTFTSMQTSSSRSRPPASG